MKLSYITYYYNTNIGISYNIIIYDININIDKLINITIFIYLCISYIINNFYSNYNIYMI